MKKDDTQYAVAGSANSEQAEPSTANRGAASLQMRILIELQVLSMLIAQAYEITEDLRKLRQDIADSIT